MEKERHLGTISPGMAVYDVQHQLVGSVVAYDQGQELVIIHDVPDYPTTVAVPRAQIISTDGGRVHLQLTLEEVQHLHPTATLAANASDDFLTGLNHDIEQDTMRQP